MVESDPLVHHPADFEREFEIAHAEQHRAGDSQQKLNHLLVEVEGSTGLPAVEHLLRVVLDHRRVTWDRAFFERGLQDASLLRMLVPVHTEQPAGKSALSRPFRATDREEPRMEIVRTAEHLAVVIRPKRKDDVLITFTQRYKIAVLLLQLLHARDGIGRERLQTVLNSRDWFASDRSFHWKLDLRCFSNSGLLERDQLSTNGGVQLGLKLRQQFGDKRSVHQSVVVSNRDATVPFSIDRPKGEDTCHESRRMLDFCSSPGDRTQRKRAGSFDAFFPRQIELPPPDEPSGKPGE